MQSKTKRGLGDYSLAFKLAIVEQAVKILV
jgi:hypothetical protein